MRRLAVFVATLLWPALAHAQANTGPEITAAYSVYAAGLITARVQAELDFTPSSYQLRLGYHTAGLFGAFVHTESNTLVQGIWQGGDVAPFHFAGSARVQGDIRQTVIDYQDGQPLIRTLVPPNDGERESVPPTMERNTIDTLSAIALMIRHVQDTGHCEAHAVTFDGRRLIDVTARTAGMQTLARSDRSPFFGPALRCDFEGRQLAGFRRGEDPEELGRPKYGSAWLAKVLPGAPPIPIRMNFETRWFGVATLYLSAVEGNVAEATH
jgi:hypothetical protein